MQRKIDIGVDKNLCIQDPGSKAKTELALSLLEETLPKSLEDAIQEAKKLNWGYWINSEPLLHAHVDEEGDAYLFPLTDVFDKKVVLFFIWEYGLLPCLRALSYVNNWYHRYADAGLLIIGVHSPFFEFSKDKDNLHDAVSELDIQFPVVLDNEFLIWKSLENRFWPRMILMDLDHTVKQDYVGEGFYQQIELEIQFLLRKYSPGLASPKVLGPLRKIDQEGYEIPPTSEEIFLGSTQSRFRGESVVISRNEFQEVYESPHFKKMKINNYYLDGPWTENHNSIISSQLGGFQSKLHVPFMGSEIYLVCQSRSKNPSDHPQFLRVQFFMDGAPLKEGHFTDDLVLNEQHFPVLQVRQPKVYHLATSLSPEQHMLSIVIEKETSDLFELYAIFFSQQ